MIYNDMHVYINTSHFQGGKTICFQVSRAQQISANGLRSLGPRVYKRGSIELLEKNELYNTVEEQTPKFLRKQVI